MSDLISRDDAIRELNGACSTWEDDAKVQEIVKALPSAELVLQTPQTYGKSINPSNAEVVADYISRADAIEAVASADETNGTVKVFSGLEIIDILKALPSAEAVSRKAKCCPIAETCMSIDCPVSSEYIGRPSAEAKPSVIRSKTLLPTKDFKEWAKRIKEVNPNAVVIPCDAEVASAEAVQTQAEKCDECIHKWTHKDKMTCKECVSAEAVQGEWKRIEINGYQYAVCDQCHLLADMVEKDGKLVMSMANADYEYANFCPNCGARMKGGEQNDD